MSDAEVNLRELHKILLKCYEDMGTILSRELHQVCSTDSAIAIGYATGCISKAKALVGRDIDQIRGN
jgi:hypothetical protein